VVTFSVHIQKFAKHAEKTGWTYIVVPAATAQRLKRGNNQTFRVKGKLDEFAITGVALLPMGGGDFLLPINAAMRRGTGKRAGDTLKVQLERDRNDLPMSAELMESLNDEPEALAFFNSLTMGHRNYFTKWIKSAKTVPTKARRIAQCVNALQQHRGFVEMVRSLRMK
jgi:hypothetical protein